MKNFKLIIEYDGSCFHGWQRQKNMATVQEEIEKAIFTMTLQKVTLSGSGRTDAGVHAMAQVANFCCHTDLSADIFLRGLNSLLSSGITIHNCISVHEDFHARYDAVSKIYHYHIINSRWPSAVFRNHCWFVKKKLDIDKMNIAAKYLIGSHDFKSFEGSGSPRKSTVRRVITAAFVKDRTGVFVFKIEADGFLRYMVRNIVGTLIDIGSGRTSVDQFYDILSSKNRNNAGITAPPQGLFLMCVKYS